MSVKHIYITALLLVLLFSAQARAEKVDGGTIFTLWPLLDYRTSPAEGFSNLSILGPLLKFQDKGEDRDTAFRPLFYNKVRGKEHTSSTYFLYPAAFHETSPDADTYEVFRLFQVSHYRKDDPAAKDHAAMLFPFYITGHSEKYGDYRSYFPIYGNIYERFWRDEYHFVLFPLYGSTVKNGTTNRHFLWPFFSTTSGEKESGFEVFPLYGQSAKEGVYSKRYVVWPFFTTSKSGLNTDNPTKKMFLAPLYGSTDSPKVTSRTYFWPFGGWTEDREHGFTETDYLWPFIYTVRGEKKHGNNFLPLYSRDVYPDGEKRWLLWPLLRHEETHSQMFNREDDRVLYFLYRHSHESWPKDGAEKSRTAAWPLFVHKTDPAGVSSFTFPAPVEPFLDKEGIEENWAPLWRLYQRRWDEDGNSASSFLWNLYWQERRGEDLAYEVFPLVFYRSTKKESEFKLLKGLVSVKTSGDRKELDLFWLPFGLKWGEK